MWGFCYGPLSRRESPISHQLGSNSGVIDRLASPPFCQSRGVVLVQPDAHRQPRCFLTARPPVPPPCFHAVATANYKQCFARTFTSFLSPSRAREANAMPWRGRGVYPSNGPVTFVLAVVIAGYDFWLDNGIARRGFRSPKRPRSPKPQNISAQKMSR